MTTEFDRLAKLKAERDELDAVIDAELKKTEFDRLFEGFKWSDSGERFAIEALFNHVRTLEAKAAKFDALVAACEREDLTQRRRLRLIAHTFAMDAALSEASEARKAVMK